jgi:hypothetical protein
MKRMSPVVYCKEADRRVQVLEFDLVSHWGEWNAYKILDEIERLLRSQRRGRKSAGALTKDSGSPKKNMCRLSSTGGTEKSPSSSSQPTPLRGLTIKVPHVWR